MLQSTLFRALLALAIASPAAAQPVTDEPAQTVLPQPNANKPQSSVELVWTVHVGGISIGTVGFKSNYVDGTYAAVSRLKTSGIVNSFYSAIIDASSTGWLRANALSPAKYDSNYEGEKAKQRVALAYTAGGINLFADPIYDTKRFPVSEDDKKDTVDPLSGIAFALSGISVSAQNRCGEPVRVFDGRRRYDIAFKFVGEDSISSAKGGYSGPVIECEMEYRQIAGFKPNLNRGRAIPKITTWFAKLPSKNGGPIGQFHVPVRIESETPLGTAVGNARNIVVDGGG